MMSSFGKIFIAGVVAMFVLLVGNTDATAQSRREIERERQRIERQRERQDRNTRQTRATRQYERYVNNVNFNNGYQYGFLAGEYDRRKGKYNRSNVYRDTPPQPYDGDPTNIDYMYRQGYLAGYEDGFYGRRNY